MEKENTSKKLLEAIVRAVAFFDLFDFPLTSLEIWQYLDVKTNLKEIEDVLEIENEYLEHSEGFYFLKNRKKIIDIRKERYNINDSKLKIAIKISKVFSTLCSIKMIAVANSIGSHNLKEDGDIDMFIVTRKKQLWITRLLLVVLVKFLNMRPREGDEKDKICLSFFVDENNLNLEKFKLKDDIYFNYWLAGLVPIYFREDTYHEFIKENHWIKKELPNWELKQVGKGRQIKSKFKFKCAFNLYESLAKEIQLRMMSSRIKELMNQDNRVVINDHVLKMHVQDNRKKYRDLFLEKINEYEISK